VLKIFILILLATVLTVGCFNFISTAEAGSSIRGCQRVANQIKIATAGANKLARIYKRQGYLTSSQDRKYRYFRSKLAAHKRYFDRHCGTNAVTPI
jgi:hypothetical protein